MKHRSTRRQFIKTTAATGFGFWVGGRVLFPESKSPNEKLNIAVIGCGGKGRSDLNNASTENIVALCDVDDNRAADAYKAFPDAKRYHDFRKLLDAEKSLDAVIVSTPDHTHAPASLMAMRLGKHVYCQKPLTHSVHEARLLRDTAKEKKVATQMGNQGSAEPGFRRGVEIIQSGILGPVREVHVWSNRPIWPQGIEKALDMQPIPDHLKWDLWLGPAPMREYNEGYCPFAWRGWWDFGTGALGDMACHTANLPFRGLKLGFPTAIEAETSGINPQTAPKWSRIRFDFPARGDMPALKFYWSDGGQKPPAELTDKLDLAGVRGGKKRKREEKLERGQVPGSGCLVVGDKGILFSPDDYGSANKIFPEDDYADYKGPAESIPRNQFGGGDRGHMQEWIHACKGGPASFSDFSIAAYLTEIILLGNIAMRVGKKIEWDGPNMKATNCPEAAQFVRREYRAGFTV